jgi:hypothetical protein
VLAGVTAEMLKLLFPASVDRITRDAAAEREAALLGGRATASDVAAGLALGRSVAAAVIARARADGMGAAVGTPALWQALADSAAARGELAWASQELPARPPMLPNFGRVQPFAMTATELARLDPPPPPSTGSAEMKAELAEVRRTVDGLTRDQLASASGGTTARAPTRRPGTGTTSPPSTCATRA